MKITLLSIYLLLGISAANAQLNASFESWTTDDPDFWTTSNQISAIGGPLTVLQETADPGTGLISAKLTTQNCPACGFVGLPDPFPGLIIQADSTTNRPEFVTFKWRGNVAIGDTALIGAAVTLLAAQVGEGYFQIMPGTNQATWVTQVVPFVYANSNVPDSFKVGALCDQYLLFGGSGTTSTSTVIYVDDFIFTGSVGFSILETNNDLIYAYPNPASTNVNFNLLGTDASMFEVLDLSGKIIYSENNILLKHSLNVSAYQSGSYIVRFFNDKKEYIGTTRFNVIR